MFDSGDVFKVALALRDLGYPIIPSGGGDTGKAPLVNWKEWQDKMPDEKQLREWQQSKKPSLWGIVTGAAPGVVVMDCDSAEAMGVMGDLKPHVKTPRGGGHYYFRHPRYKVVA